MFPEIVPTCVCLCLHFRMDLVSIIMCVRNSEQWLSESLQSISSQTYPGPLELSIFDDGSSDQSAAIITGWHLRNNHVKLTISANRNCDTPGGVGFAKNRAVEQSSGRFLCFFDSDDIMDPDRIKLQYEECLRNKDAIVGCQIRRMPENSTPRYVDWANRLSPKELSSQIYTCFGPTVLMPTWFCTRAVYHTVGAFDQSMSRGIPEDLIFFYRHLELGGKVVRVDRVLLTYRYHLTATTFSVTDETIWSVRLKQLEKNVLPNWPQFTIWNAGKEGRRFYRSLSDESRAKVTAFCDVDVKKIAKHFYTHEEGDKTKVPVVHFRDAKPPLVVCVKLGLYNGNFETNLRSLNLREGIDFVHFG